MRQGCWFLDPRFTVRGGAPAIRYVRGRFQGWGYTNLARVAGKPLEEILLPGNAILSTLHHPVTGPRHQGDFMLHRHSWLARSPASLLLLALVGISQAQAQSAPADVPSAVPAQRAFKDPATGQLRAPEHDEQAAAREAAAAKAASPAARSAAGSAEQRAQAMRRFSGIVPLTASNGATGRRLDTSRLSFAVAKRNADGSISLRLRCRRKRGASGAAWPRPRRRAGGQPCEMNFTSRGAFWPL